LGAEIGRKDQCGSEGEKTFVHDSRVRREDVAHPVGRMRAIR
jgi:hypothetical protein